MAGYNGYSMSNNALQAYENGLKPASKISGIPARLIRQFCEPDEWHHSSKAYNKVNFYNVNYVRATFGLDTLHHDDDDEEYQANENAVKALADYKLSQKKKSNVFENCVVSWLEWSGSLRRPKCEKMTATGCTVSVKGQTATITLKNGFVFKKRLTTNGFSFEVNVK